MKASLHCIICFTHPVREPCLTNGHFSTSAGGGLQRHRSGWTEFDFIHACIPGKKKRREKKRKKNFHGMSLRSLFCLMHCGIANSFYGGMYTVYIRHIFAGSARDALKVHGQRCPSRPSKAIYICLVRFGRNIIHINKFDAYLYAPDGIHSYQDNFYIKPYAFHLNQSKFITFRHISTTLDSKPRLK